MTTIETAFGGGVPLINLDECAPIPCCFVLQLPDKLTPTDIGDSLSQTGVFDHVLDLQTLDANRLVLTDQLCRELVLVVPSPIGDPSMDTGDFQTSFRAVLGAFVLLGKTTLCLRQLLFILLEELGIAGGLPIGGDDQRLQAQVKPHLLIHYWQRLDVFF